MKKYLVEFVDESDDGRDGKRYELKPEDDFREVVLKFLQNLDFQWEDVDMSNSVLAINNTFVLINTFVEHSSSFVKVLDENELAELDAKKTK